MTEPVSAPSLSPAARMALVAGWGFVLAKALVIGHLLTGAWGGRIVAAVASGFGADALVALALLGVGTAVERATGDEARAARWGLPAFGALLGLYALLNVMIVVEIGRPVTPEMLQIDVGTGEATTMLASAGGLLTLGGAAFFLVSAAPLVRLVEGRLRPGRRLVAALAAYGLLAVAFVRSEPLVASIYGLHRNAVSEMALGALAQTSWFAYAHTATLDFARIEFPVPEDEAFTAPVPVERGASPKHVVLWLAESTGARYTSLFDESLGTTPNAVRLGGKGLRFTRYYSNATMSEKAFFTILCGLYPYPANHPMASVNPRIACPSLMETLTGRGYRAGFFTGALLGFGDKQRLLAERGFEVLVDGENVPNKRKFWGDGWGVEDAAIVDEALRWLDARPDRDQPQLTVMVPIIPHVPYNLPPHAPTPFGTATREARYLAGVQYSDAQFGRLYDAYVERGLADDTLFVYVGDHGEAFEQHPGSNGHASFAYEENVHVPLLFVNPRLFPEGQVSERLGSHVDLMPTILDLLGQPGPDGGDGQSLVADDYRYKPVFVGAFMRDRLGGLRDGDMKYILNFDTGFEEVYDLAADPLERDNLVERTDPEQVRAWRAWVTAQQTRQKTFLEEHPVMGPTYLERVLDGMTVALEDGEGRVECRQVPRPRAIRCPGVPTQVEVTLSRHAIRHVNRGCITVHPPPKGRMVVEFPSVEPPPSLVAVGLPDTARLAGGTPLEVTWHIGDLEPIRVVVDDEPHKAYKTVRVPETGQASVPIRVEVDSEDWFNRMGCLVLTP